MKKIIKLSAERTGSQDDIQTKGKDKVSKSWQSQNWQRGNEKKNQCRQCKWKYSKSAFLTPLISDTYS